MKFLNLYWRKAILKCFQIIRIVLLNNIFIIIKNIKPLFLFKNYLTRYNIVKIILKDIFWQGLVPTQHLQIVRYSQANTKTVVDIRS